MESRLRRLCLCLAIAGAMAVGCSRGPSHPPLQRPPATQPAQPSPQPATPEPPPQQLSDAERDSVLFTHWRSKRAGEVDTFSAYLVDQNLADVVPMYQLLRSASMWKECQAEPFQVPPQDQWEKVRDVLILLRDLQQRGVLPAFEVVSAYRDPRLNRCAGGAPRSSHQHFAVDIAPLEPEIAAGLCRFWREQGKDWDMGVSRYPSGRIHIDRTGYRTWGASHKRSSSYCLDVA
jgi:hypothetical protein